MHPIKIIIIILTFTISVAAITSIGYAGTAASVNKAWAGVNYYDDSGQVSLGSTVNIYWTGVVASSQGDTVDITVIDPDGNNITNWMDLTPTDSGNVSFVPDKTGSYAVIFDGHPTYYHFSTVVAVSSVFVLPESFLGTLLALSTGFTAIGVFRVWKTRKHYNPITNKTQLSRG
ncbi:MAG: emp24/gp25L/p24 family protein [Candidatus Bathyarchaeota archaeon]|nr:emp24/gp25L/p24 family protein [Candidatus Bathyarchaeota archaeon]